MARDDRYEVFSYLTPLRADEVRLRVESILRSGLIPAIEYARPERAGRAYWRAWGAPLAGDVDTGRVLAEIRACQRANPGALVKVVGYDRHRRCEQVAFVVREPLVPG